MGGGASSVSRLRKSLVIRAYNMRKPDDTFDDQFRKYAFKKEDGTHCISVKDIRFCLQLESGEYCWVDDLFMHSFGAAIEDINYYDFIRFLDSGKMPVLTPSRTEGRADPANKEKGGPSSSVRSDPIKLEGGAPHKGKIPKGFPPIPPSAPPDSNITITQMSPRNGNQEGDNESVDELHINLSSMTTTSDLLYPEKVNIGDDNAGIAADTTTIIVHPSRRAGLNGTGTILEPFSPGKATPLWRKREVVRHERTVHYTTVEPDGSQQELVEKETTQTEVLHMESRETGEFAHRELTQFQQVETFNGEAVNEVNGQEEYVHLKSLEDEFHYSESTMPRRENAAPPDDDEHKAGVQNEDEREHIAGAQGDYDSSHVDGEEGYNNRGEHHDDHNHRPGYAHKHEEGHGPVPGHEDERYRSAEAHYKLDPEYVAEMEEKERELERERLRRMQDAFYYAEEQEREENEKMMSNGDDSVNAKDPKVEGANHDFFGEDSHTKYGEPVCFDDENNGDGKDRTAAPPIQRDDLFAPPTPVDRVPASDTQQQTSAFEDAPVQGRSSAMSHSASYESMHDID